MCGLGISYYNALFIGMKWSGRVIYDSLVAIKLRECAYESCFIGMKLRDMAIELAVLFCCDKIGEEEGWMLKRRIFYIKDTSENLLNTVILYY